MSLVSRALVIVLAAVVLLPTVAAAGYRVVDQNGEQTLISSGRLKMVSKSGEGRGADDNAMVLDMNRARLWMADRTKRTYWEGTVEELCAGMRDLMNAAFAGVGQEMQKQLAEMEKQMASMSKEERDQMRQMQKMMEQMSKGMAKETPGAAPTPKKIRRVTVERTGETATIAGLPTQKFRVLADGKLYEEHWLANDPALVRELNLERAPDTFGRMFACLFANAKAAGGQTGDTIEDTAEYRRLFSQGWPLKVISYHEDEGGAPGKGKTTTFVGTIERRDFPESEFRPPAGFRKTSFSEAFGGN
jgi:hypothetical protein